MADLHIQREHSLGFAAARKVAFEWAEQAEQEFDMECTYVEGDDLDEVVFQRSGVSGVLRVSQDRFDLTAKLGFLLGAFKDKIEAEIVKNLDALLAAKPANKAASKAAVKTGAKKSSTHATFLIAARAHSAGARCRFSSKTQSGRCTVALHRRCWCP